MGFSSPSSPNTSTSPLALQVCTIFEPHLEPSPQLRPCPCATHPRCPLYPWHESHEWRDRVCAGSELIMSPVHPERPASSLAASGAPRRPMRLVGPPPSLAAHNCLRAAGSRATPWTASDDPGRLRCFLVMNFLIAPYFLLALSVCSVEISGRVL